MKHKISLLMRDTCIIIMSTAIDNVFKLDIHNLPLLGGIVLTDIIN